MKSTRDTRALPGDGVLLQLLGLLHAAVGALLFHRELRSIARDGVVGTISLRGPKSTPFWFLVASPLIWIAGRLVARAESAGDLDAVREAHWAGLMSATVAALCMPVSGFWGWLAISARGLWRTRKSKR